MDKRSVSTIISYGGCATLIHPTLNRYVYSFSLLLVYTNRHMF